MQTSLLRDDPIGDYDFMTTGTRSRSWDYTGNGGHQLWRDERPRYGRKTVYIFGKITYSDIFPGTKTHITEFCLMRVVGDSFTICPRGNRMD